MSVLAIVIPLALLLAAGALAAFVWSIKAGQLDDLDTPGARVLFDDDDVASREKTERDRGAT